MARIIAIWWSIGEFVSAEQGSSELRTPLWEMLATPL